MFIKNDLEEALLLLQNFINNRDNIEKINKAVDLFVDSISSCGKIFSCGNGGSMCDSMHFAEELTGRFRKDRAPLPAISLSDSPHISCVANDYGFEHIFSRPIEALGKKEDVLLAISTSGNSRNVINAVNSAKDKGIKVVGLLGKDGGKLKNLVDIPFVIESKTTERIQEIHIKLIHIFIEGIERRLFPENYQ